MVWGESINTVGGGAFQCPLEEVYYKGTNFYNGSINGFPEEISYLYSESEPALNSEGTAYNGRYWRYVDGVPTVWVYSKVTE